MAARGSASRATSVISLPLPASMPLPQSTSRTPSRRCVTAPRRDIRADAAPASRQKMASASAQLGEIAGGADRSVRA